MARVSSTYMREETTSAIRTLSTVKRKGLERFSINRNSSHENMIKYVILLSTLACLSHCQRPSYAGTAGRYPLVLPQYTKTPAAPSVGNRIDSQDTITTGIIRPAAASAAVTTTAVPLDLPVEAHGDADLVNRIMTWPRDKQPFWYINQQQINAHRGVLNVAGTATQPPQTESRSFFAG